MSPLLFPILLILYSEFSTEVDVKLLARVLFFGYGFSLVLLTILPPVSLTLLIAVIPYLLSYSYLIFKVKLVQVRVLLALLIILQCFNYFNIYFQSYALLQMFSFYFEYSNIILRELSLFCIGACTINFKTDINLKVSTGVLYVIEYSYIAGF